MPYSPSGNKNKKYDYEICCMKLKSVQCVKDFGATIASNLKFSHHCKVTAGKINRLLGFINRNFSFKNNDIILLLYINLVTPHLEHGVEFWSPCLTKDIAKLEAVQSRATKIIPSLHNKSYEERLARLNLFSPPRVF